MAMKRIFFFFFVSFNMAKEIKREGEGKRNMTVSLYRGYPVHISANTVEGPKELWFCLFG